VAVALYPALQADADELERSGRLDHLAQMTTAGTAG